MHDDKIRIKVPTVDFLGNGLDIVIIIVIIIVFFFFIYNNKIFLAYKAIYIYGYLVTLIFDYFNMIIVK